MTTAELIAQLPDETRVSVTIGGDGVTVGELRAALASSGPVMLTTRQASERYGWSREYWAERAVDMPGAVKGREWHLPAGAVEAHVRSLSDNGRRRRAPAPPQTRNARPQGLSPR